MTEATKTISEELLTFRQLLLDDLVKIIEEHQPVTLRRWLKPGEAMHILGVSRHKLNVLRDTGAIAVRKVGESHFYDRESVMRFCAAPAESPQSTPESIGVKQDHSPQLNAEASPRSADDGPPLNSKFKVQNSKCEETHDSQRYAGMVDEVSGVEIQQR